MSDKKQQSVSEKYQIIASRGDDNSFYYAVRTTGIFCRPGCPARLPKRENTIFFDTSREALEAGFRPCMKCHPLRRGNGQADLITEVCRLLENSEVTPTMKILAGKTGYSERHIQRIFKEMTGISPGNYSRAVKSRRLRENISRGAAMTDAIYSAGYGSPSRVYENTDKLLGMSPSQYRKSGEGLELRMGIFRCSLGFALIAFTDRGVSSVELGDREAELAEDFRKRFFRAKLTDLNENDNSLVRLVLKKIENPRIPAEIPLDIHGTLFQQRVWNALRNIPAGEVRSYSDIAEAIGKPGSVRAVANACGRNGIAVLVPCHRVIRKNGETGGYRWGAYRKGKLLQREDVVLDRGKKKTV